MCVCLCGANYKGGTVHMIRTQNVSVMNFNGLSQACKSSFKWKVLKAYFLKIIIYTPSLNNQLKTDILTLFHNGIT